MVDLLKIIPQPYREYDLTAASFVLTGLLGRVLLRRCHLLPVAPVSYSEVVHEMLDAIVVLDARRRPGAQEPAPPCALCAPPPLQA